MTFPNQILMCTPCSHPACYTSRPSTPLFQYKRSLFKKLVWLFLIVCLAFHSHSLVSQVRAFGEMSVCRATIWFVQINDYAQTDNVWSVITEGTTQFLFTAVFTVMYISLTEFRYKKINTGEFFFRTDNDHVVRKSPVVRNPKVYEYNHVHKCFNEPLAWSVHTITHI